jgi:SAM-dependent methyltransferase
MGNLTKWLDLNLYPQYSTNWDDKIFREKILIHINSRSVVLDLGAGAGIVTQMNFRGLPAQMCGVDLDPRVVDNPLLDEGRVANAEGIPYENGKFDIVFADNVFEDLDDPLKVYLEVARCLKPGGVFLFKTPNKWHYMPTIARITPHWFHQYVNKLRGRQEIDTFPTRYRTNTKYDVKHLAKQAGLLISNLELIEGRPEYLRMTWITYLFGIMYERIVNSSQIFSSFRILLIGSLVKPLNSDTDETNSSIS